MEHVNFDYKRATRTAIPEAVFSTGKPKSVLIDMLCSFADPSAVAVLFTRLDKSVFDELPGNIKRSYDYEEISQTAFAKKIETPIEGSVAIVSAGTADSPVALECARTLQFLNVNHKVFEDCGVSGLWRLENKIEEINSYNLVICVAGMEAAIASVLAGLTPRPVIGCPTSTGYGVCTGGKTALNAMLACCSPGISVVNIDNGFGAACLAYKILLSFEEKA